MSNLIKTLNYHAKRHSVGGCDKTTGKVLYAAISAIEELEAKLRGKKTKIETLEAYINEVSINE